MALDLSSLQKAVFALDGAVNSYLKNQSNQTLSDTDKETLKSGVIQNYEVAYELCWKFMKRWIEEQVSPNLVEGKPRIELYRIAAENGLIMDVDEWMRYHVARNLTSHTYDSANAEKAFDFAMVFIHEAKRFLQTLEAKND